MHIGCNVPLTRRCASTSPRRRGGLGLVWRRIAAAFTPQGGPATRGAAARPIARRLAPRSITLGTSFAEAARRRRRARTLRLAPWTAISIAATAVATTTAATAATKAATATSVALAAALTPTAFVERSTFATTVAIARWRAFTTLALVAVFSGLE